MQTNESPQAESANTPTPSPDPARRTLPDATWCKHVEIGAQTLLIFPDPDTRIVSVYRLDSQRPKVLLFTCGAKHFDALIDALIDVSQIIEAPQ